VLGNSQTVSEIFFRLSMIAMGNYLLQKHRFSQ
jgi:hypothetical protein